MNNNLDDIDILDDDLPGNDKRYKQKLKKDVRLVYDSDSSEEDYEKTQEQQTDKDGDDSNDDMFASDDGDKLAKNNTKNNESDILNPIERDEFDDVDERYTLKSSHNGEGEDNEEHNSDDSYDSQESIGYFNDRENSGNHHSSIVPTKSKMIPKIEPFDLQEEEKDGKFDEDGIYIRNDNSDGEGKEEVWMTMKKSDIKQAKEAQLARERMDRQKKLQSSGEQAPTDELLSKLIDLLEPSDTPMETLAKFAPRKISRNLKRAQIKDESEQRRRRIVIELTELCDKLINDKGMSDIYDLSREELMRKYYLETNIDLRKSSRGIKRAREEPSDEETDYGAKIWEFKWIGQDDVNGPYSEYEMYHWSNSYFEDNVIVRKVGESQFKPIDTVTFNVDIFL